nr:IS110 family transposase [Rhodococcus erythropolis]
MGLYCGIDWAENHHDFAILNDLGEVVSRGRVDNDAAGFARLLEAFAEAGDTAEDPIPVGIETDHGLWVAGLRASGRVIYPINPLAASRYRSRHSVSGSKSDSADAVMLANIVRTDAVAHRPLPADTDSALAIRVLARAQQDAVWSRQRFGNEIRSLLKEYFPAALTAFQSLEDGLTRPDARSVLAAAPTPTAAAALTRPQLKAALKRAGRSRFLDRDVERLRAIMRAPALRQPPQIEAAMGISLMTLLRQFDAACTAAETLAAHVSVLFSEHPDAKIITSFPGLGPLAGARVLAEIGDDRNRFATARGLKAYAGAAPITRASGKKNLRPAPARQEPATGSSGNDLGVQRPASVPRRPTTFRRSPRRRRLEPPSPTTPVQPIPRPTPPLPYHPRILSTNCTHFHLPSRSRLDS